MGMLLTYREGYYPDDAREDNTERAEVEAAGTPGENPGGNRDDFTDMSDEQVAEAYATNVGGNATTRRGMVKALRKLEDDAAEDSQPDPENPPEPASDPEQPDPENPPADAEGTESE